MQDPAFGREQPVVGRLLDQRMPELVAFARPVLVDEQQLGVDRAAQRQTELGFRQTAHLGEECVVDLTARDRGDLDEPAGGLGAGRQADLQDAAECFGQAFAPATRLLGRSHQFLGEERVPVGTPGDRIDKGRRRRRAGDGGQQFDQLVALEPLEVDALDARLALGLGEPRRQWMAAMQLVTPEGRDHQQALIARVPRQECEQVACRPVGPVHVLDDEEDRVRLAEPPNSRSAPSKIRVWSHSVCPAGAISPDDRRHLGDQACELGQAGPGGLGDPFRVDLAGQRPKGFDDRTERQAILAERDGAALDDQPVAIAQTADGLSDQTALADPGLATDEEERGMAGGSRIGRREERLQLLRTADEGRAAQAPGHALA